MRKALAIAALLSTTAGAYAQETDCYSQPNGNGWQMHCSGFAPAPAPQPNPNGGLYGGLARGLDAVRQNMELGAQMQQQEEMLELQRRNLELQQQQLELQRQIQRQQQTQKSGSQAPRQATSSTGVTADEDQKGLCTVDNPRNC